MRRFDRIPAPLAGLLAGTALTGAAIAAFAIALSFVVTGNFLFEAEVQGTGVEAVTPYFGAVAMALLGTVAVLGAELVGWAWLRRR